MALSLAASVGSGAWLPSKLVISFIAALSCCAGALRFCLIFAVRVCCRFF